MPNDDLESRVSSLEHEMVRLREQVAFTSSEAVAARVLAAGADRASRRSVLSCVPIHRASTPCGRPSWSKVRG
jgi:hypothetical protein